MMKFVLGLACLGLPLILVGCDDPIVVIKNAFATAGEIGSSSVTPKVVVIAESAYDGLETAATNYIRLPNCVIGGSKICRNQTVAATIVSLVRAGRVARSNVDAFMKANHGANVPSALYSALTSATDTLKAISSEFSVSVSTTPPAAS